MNLKIGTRGSKLALWQAHHLKDVLEGGGLSVELVLYTTKGDLQQAQPLHEIGDKGLFTQALDDAMLRGEIDVAVHSAKDLPTQLPEGIVLAAVGNREDPRDVLLSSSEEYDLDNVARGITVGTSSLRRKALLMHYLPHVKVVPMRGNVDTRVAKMLAGDCNGILLAYAGVKRMGLTHLITRKLNVSTFTPAVGQGAIGVTMPVGHPATDTLRSLFNHADTELAVKAERAFLHTLEGGCQSAIFALGTVVGQTLSLMGGIASTDGSQVLRESADCSLSEAEATGKRLAELLLQKGARTILHGKEN
ncbi:MAG: hydroxymethylbilane synthase [Bacteroidia bacterium]|nr:hydroxymethylbilane synthase [Bacteroidota bacterium]MBP6640403.1 hydroxymethylbilane synthase [Bacteroidia bacterium]MBP8073410.1 hydroxymethylbilane synthase [Bacteroidia bacterium]